MPGPRRAAARARARRPSRQSTLRGDRPLRMPAYSVKSKPGERRGRCRAHATRASPHALRPAALPPAVKCCTKPSRLVSEPSILRQRGDRQDHVGDGARGFARVVAEGDDLRARQRLERERLVGEVEARFDAVDHVGAARIGEHRLRARARPAARRAATGRARSRPAGCGTASRCSPRRSHARRRGSRWRVRPSSATPPTITTARCAPAMSTPASAVASSAHRHDRLRRDIEGDIEIDRVDHVHARALALRLAHALVQQRQLMAQVRAHDHDDVGVVDVGDRHRELFGDRTVGRVALREAMVEVARAQAFGEARKQRALLVRRRRMHEHAELVAAVVAQDLRGLGQRFFPAGFAPVVAVARPSASRRDTGRTGPGARSDRDPTASIR